MTRLIIDGSSIAWTSLFAGKDEEFGKVVEHNGKKVQVNSAQFGYENAINMITSAWDRFNIAPIDTIFVREGMNSKKPRTLISADYKAKSKGAKAPEAYQEFTKLLDMLVSTLLSIGGTAVSQSEVEGDDVIAYLTKHLDGEKVILTGDGDLAALVSPTVHIWRKSELDQNPYGEFPHKYITVYKALVGDTSDNIKGAPGFGEKSFLDMLCIFGEDGLEMMEDLILNNKLRLLIEDVDHLKSLQKILNDPQSVYISYELAALKPELVNTKDNALAWLSGYVKEKSHITDERLRKWAGKHRMVHKTNFADALAFFKSKMAESPTVTLDLETSVGEKSDEWLAQRTDKGGGVDVIGSEITGCGLTFGSNNQYSYYVTVNHKFDFATPNVTLDQLGQMLEAVPKTTMTLAHNAAGFELPVLANAFMKKWAKNGWRGLYPNMIDTRIAASYWDEDVFSHGLKQLSLSLLGYEQVSYDAVTQGRKMDQITVEEVFAYGIDDVVMTPALWNFFRMRMEIEGTLAAFLHLEQKPMYLSALSYLDGLKVDLERLFTLKKVDESLQTENRVVLDEFLIREGWEGTQVPVFKELDAPSIKALYLAITGQDIKTQMRTPDKIFKLIDTLEHPEASLIATLMASDNLTELNKLVAQRFDGTPIFQESSPKQMKSLLYDTLKLPIRLRNKATDVMRGKGIFEGTPRTDEDSMRMALKMGDAGDNKGVLEALMNLRSINTRSGLYWKPYPRAIHWKTGNIHPELRQSATNTRRWTSANPNIQQLDSSYGGVRSVILPHHKDAVVVSLDESGQEVRLAAAYSQDANLLSCFMGQKDQLRDVHSIVACKIAGVDYATFRARLKDPATAEACGKIRGIAKTVLFASFYGAAAPKIAESLGISEIEAQDYIDTIYSQFPDLARWKQRTEEFARMKGYVDVWGGTRRHLATLLASDNNYERSKALRQASNASIQSAGANQIKTVMSCIWDSDLLERFDMKWMCPVHDEIVLSINRKDAAAAIKELHGFMVAPFLAGGVPSASSIGIGKSFGSLIELGEVFDADKIEATLAEMFKEGVTV